MKSKKGRLKKVLSMILCGVLFTMSFALSDLGNVKAYAAEPPTALGNYEFTLELPTTPVSGASILDNTGANVTVVTGGGGHCTAKIYGEWFPGGEKFLGGREYQVEVLITADDGFYLPHSYASSAGVTVHVADDNGSSTWSGGETKINPEDVHDGYKSFRVLAKFTCPKEKIDVTFNDGGGSGSMDPQNVDEGDYTLPPCTFTPPPNKKFIGWAVGNPDATPLYQTDNKVELRSDTTIYAKYADKSSYALTINCDPYKGSIVVTDGSHSLDPSAIPEGTFVRLTAQPKSGWKFKEGGTCGWDYHMPNLDCDGEYLSFNMPGSNITVSKDFEKDSAAMTITLDPQGGYVEPIEIMTDENGKLLERNGYTSKELPTPSAYGATFKYWSTSKNGTEYDKNAQFTEATTLYAVWDGTPKPYPKKDQSSASAHVHSFKWQTITEPTKDCDGLEGEVCSCGATGRTQPLSAYVYSINEYAVPMINSAKAGQTVTFEFGEWNSFPKAFMEKIAAKSMEGVTFVFHYKWNHVKQEITIPFGTAVDTSFDWYGPAKMAELYGAN